MILVKFESAGWRTALLATLTLGCAPSAPPQSNPQGSSQGEVPIDVNVAEEPEEPDSKRGDIESAPVNLREAARLAEEDWLRRSEQVGPTAAPGSASVGIRTPSSRTGAGQPTANTWTWGGRTLSAQPLYAQLAGQMGPRVGSPGLWLLSIKEPITGWTEEFLLQVALPPGISAQSERPLLVAFHRYGNTMFDIPVNTDYPDATAELGWFLLAPLGAATINVASRESQINTRLVIEFVLENYPVDTDRIYAVGHSMGGGNMLNFAARHTDLSGPTFAAVVNHTGTLSQKHSYVHDCAPGGGQCISPNPWEFWYGGTPATVPFEYVMASVIDLPYVNGLMGPPPLADPTTSLAANLVHLPILSFWADSDPLVELIAQNEAFAAHMTALGSTNHETRVVADNRHLWETLDARDACKWLGKFTLSKPASGASLGFEDGRLFYFELEQDQADTLSPFQWAIDSGLGIVSIEDTENLGKITVDLTVAEIDPSLTGLEVHLRPGDGTTDQVVFENVASGPTAVLRDNSTVNAPWAYDATMLRLTLWENDGSATHVWNCTF